MVVCQKVQPLPIFRGYCISSVNLAEIRHSTLKRTKPFALVDAAWEDTCTMILQEQEHTKFLAGGCYSSSAGSNAENEKRQQMKSSRDYQRAFIEQNYDMANKDRMFLPGKRAKHRHPELPAATVEGKEQIAIYGLAATEAESSGNPTAGNATVRGPLQPKKLNSNCENTPYFAFCRASRSVSAMGVKTSLPHNRRRPLMTL